MAGQGWSFDALDHGIDYQQNGLDDPNNFDHDYDDTYDNGYNDVQGATWADLEDTYEMGEHWSSDTWNEPHTEHAANHTAASVQPQYTSQYNPQHTSHTRAPPSSPPRHMNDSGPRPTNTHHAPLRPDALPAAQSETTYRRTSGDLHLHPPYRPATFTEAPSQNPPSRSGIESFLRRPNQEEDARNNALNQNILDNNSQVVDSDSDNGDDNMPRTRRAHRAPNNNTVDLTQSPNISTAHQSRTRKRESVSDAGSATKRARRAVVEDDEVFEDEAPSAEAELLQAQQADALKMQETHNDEEAVKIGKRNCIICLESYTNATTAACGHIFCHECLTRALMASEKNNDRGKGNCPACRKAINRKNAKEVIPIAFLKKSAFKTKGRQAHNK